MGTPSLAPQEEDLWAKQAKKRATKKTAARPTRQAPKLLSDLFLETLKDIYYAENKIIKTLPKMAKAAHSKDLAAAFNKHLRETQGQVKRPEQTFKMLGKPARGKPCDAINGIADEGAEIMKDFKNAPALDAGLLAAAQAVEHYEISRYGTLRTWAKELGMPDAARLLQATLDEEQATDRTLTEFATSVINLEAEDEYRAAA
ncbi:ferritin-like metal-binding protein YciE [Bradyrhizobium sp. F1.4.3]|uniref:YciE/YciF ferroxidase family protein n=1 Tax=Bradyrhizobium sp. F1.4.3 TaxID=3156356 RepID=UPI00339B1736